VLRAPAERIRYTRKFEDPNLPGEIQMTVELSRVQKPGSLGFAQGLDLGMGQLYAFKLASDDVA
jgi:hypothetical protein